MLTKTKNEERIAMKVVIYGAGSTGREVYNNIKEKVSVVGFLDGNPEKKGHIIVDGVKCIGGVEALSGMDYDRVYIGSVFWEDIKSTLIYNNVDEEKIIVELPVDSVSDVRNIWLDCYAKLHSDDDAFVAEGGVFRGEFAKQINKAFPNSQLFLFDTFEGFDQRDVKYEQTNYDFNLKAGEFSNTSVDLVMSKMIYPDKVIIRKGFFPETTTGIDGRFCFVNLDFDLYNPILEGLRFFYPKMIEGCILLIHDYYNSALPGVRDAIADYEREIGRKIYKMPIGDDQSIALIKTNG